MYKIRKKYSIFSSLILICLIILTIFSGTAKTNNVSEITADYDGLVLNKEVKINNDFYDVDIDAYTTDTVNNGNLFNADIVFLMDISSSLVPDEIGQERDAVKETIRFLKDKNCRACIIAFNNANYYRTRIKTGGSWLFPKYNNYGFYDINDENENILVEAADVSEVWAAVWNFTSDTKNAIKAARYAFNSLYGQELESMESYPSDRKQAVVLLTDGIPGAGFGEINANGDVDTDEVNDTIKLTNKMKRMGASICTIGLAKELATETFNGNYSKKDIQEKILNKTDQEIKSMTKKAITVLNLMSSNYYQEDRNKTDSIVWNVWKKNGHSNGYKYNTDLWGIENVTEYSWVLFVDPDEPYGSKIQTLLTQKLSGIQINSQIDEACQLIETISPYFDIVPNSLKVAAVPFGINGTYIKNDKLIFDDSKKIQLSNGNNTIDEKEYNISIVEKDNQIIISEWDYNNSDIVICNNSLTHSGYKLHISYKIKPKDGFIGGSDVPVFEKNNSGLFNSNLNIAFYYNSNNDNPLAKELTADIDLIPTRLISESFNTYLYTTITTNDLASMTLNDNSKTYYQYNGRYSDKLYKIIKIGEDYAVYDTTDNSNLVNFSKYITVGNISLDTNENMFIDNPNKKIDISSTIKWRNKDGKTGISEISVIGDIPLNVYQPYIVTKDAIYEENTIYRDIPAGYNIQNEVTEIYTKDWSQDFISDKQWGYFNSATIMLPKEETVFLGEKPQYSVLYQMYNADGTIKSKYQYEYNSVDKIYFPSETSVQQSKFNDNDYITLQYKTVVDDVEYTGIPLINWISCDDEDVLHNGNAQIHLKEKESTIKLKIRQSNVNENDVIVYDVGIVYYSINDKKYNYRTIDTISATGTSSVNLTLPIPSYSDYAFYIVPRTNMTSKSLTYKYNTVGKITIGERIKLIGLGNDEISSILGLNNGIDTSSAVLVKPIDNTIEVLFNHQSTNYVEDSKTANYVVNNVFNANGTVVQTD